jgi:hypothetical protein
LVFSHREGFELLSRWKKLWAKNGKTDPGLKVFMVNEVMPFWAQCTKCEKWRQIERTEKLTPEFCKTFVCDEKSVLEKVSHAGKIQTPLCPFDMMFHGL